MKAAVQKQRTAAAVSGAMAGMKGDLGLGSAIGAKPQNPECLAKAFDAHADEADKKIAREDLADVLYLAWVVPVRATSASKPIFAAKG